MRPTSSAPEAAVDVYDPDAQGRASRTLAVVIVTGIWPPDVGGPATHGPDLAAFLLARGDRVRGVTTAAGRPSATRFPLRALPREASLPRRMAQGAATIAASSRDADVVYATGMYARSALAARAIGVPLVIKLVNDPAFERAQSRGLFDGSLEDFQSHNTAGPQIRALRRLRTWTLEQADRIVVPSQYLAEIAAGWSVARERFAVVPNPAPAAGDLPSREDLRLRFGFAGMTLVYAGRFVEQKDLPLAVASLHHAPLATLVLIGEGPER